MTDFERPAMPGMIRITRDEAMSSHVDDLLQRQRSLRGDASGHRVHGRRWYYQNWLVFMLVGGLASLAAWALLEPFFDDLLIVQGVVTDLSPDDVPDDVVLPGGQFLQICLPTRGSFSIDGQKLWLLEQTYRLEPNGGTTLLEPNDVQPGKQLSVYVEYQLLGNEEMAIARLIDVHPPEKPPAKASLNLRKQQARSTAAGLLLFAVVGGLIGLAIGAADGLVCRVPRRAFFGGGIGLLVGFVGGFISSIVANLAYAPLNELAMQQSNGLGDLTVFGFAVQMTGRGLAWLLAGMTMGLGQGIALRSPRLLLYGFLGGVLGGLIGGLLFDPIDFILLGGIKPSAHWSRLIGLATVGMSVGAMIGVVELLARDAWLQMVAGPLAGKEFLIFKDTVNLGSSPRAEIYLFNDPQVAGIHATIRAVGEQCEIENRSSENPTELNGHRFDRARLRHGDQITLGKTVFVFQQRQG